MMSEITIADLRVGQERIEGKVNLLKEVQTANHGQNRRDIHDIRDLAQTAVDGLTAMQLKWAKMTGYAMGAGAMVGGIVAVIVKLIDHLWK